MDRKLIHVLDKIGFVELQEVFGDERTVVNCARVSFGKQVEVLEERDISLIRYLARHKHHSPFRHVMFRFRIRAPEVVMRQWYKHVIGAEWSASTPFHAWNEISGRYVVMEEVHHPTVWRRQSDQCKQGSAGIMEDQDQLECIALYRDAVGHMMEVYQQLLERGVAREQARLILPMSLYTETIWTCSFQAVMNFLELRLDSHAQFEIQEFADAVRQLVQDRVPVLYRCWSENTNIHLTSPPTDRTNGGNDSGRTGNEA